MDEGHTPRNRETDVLKSLNRVETARKVVLSGTLFQNHVEEVFNILNLVRPKFLKLESSLPIVRRLMNQVTVSGGRSKGIVDSAFTESVEKTLLNDVCFKRKAHVIRGLRELTKDAIHYYKGDILDELPGLLDFSVFLKLTPMQKEIIQNKMGAYEVNADDRANTLTDKSVDSMIDSVNVNDGVKARACGEGISLVGASRVVILDVHLNPSVTRQAIGRAFRPGQQKKVFVYRLVAADSAEEKHHETSFKKEVIPKLWFEWSEHCTTEDFKLVQVDIDESMDELLDTKAMRQDIKALYKR
ncbi:hypothetical protein HU200_066376 [Digitaria exilis]|uniref:Uncharacterized protein n=1 Tax=Digitaria exilis TaxID=1010633 RepID=A0A834ZX64_9POAL|nr:hypothetical protein HU200_066376 [Digitaria exilis]